jgi:hypothetical protein
MISESSRYARLNAHGRRALGGVRLRRANWRRASPPPQS